MLRKKFVIPTIIISSILFTLAFFNWQFGFLIYLFLVPYLLLSYNFSRRQLFYSGWLFGFLAQGLNLIWIIPTIINGGAGVILAIIGWLGLSLYCGLYFAAFFWLNKIFSPDFIITKIIFSASLWTVLEYIRSHIFNGFPFGVLGYAPVKYLFLLSPAKIGGVYAVSFFIVAFNFAFADLFRTYHKVKTIVILIIIIFLNVVGALDIFDFKVVNKLKIALLQGNISQQEKFNCFYRDKIINTYETLTQKVIPEKPDIIIWPETAWPDLLNTFVQEIPIRAGKTFQIIGALTSDNERYYNSAILLDRRQKIAWIHHKTHLIPFGEFIPFRRLLGFIDYFQTYGDITPGKKLFSPTEIDLQGKKIKIGLTICSENFFPEISWQWAKNGADIIINITNDAWFGRTSALPQHFAMNVLRSVETGLPVVVAGNSGITGNIQANGKISAILPVYQSGFLVQKIFLENHPTFYRKFGNIFVIITFVVVIMAIGRKIYVNRVTKEDSGFKGVSLT